MVCWDSSTPALQRLPPTAILSGSRRATWGSRIPICMAEELAPKFLVPSRPSGQRCEPRRTPNVIMTGGRFRPPIRAGAGKGEVQGPTPLSDSDSCLILGLHLSRPSRVEDERVLWDGPSVVGRIPEKSEFDADTLLGAPYPLR
jgi:hypothetical protein